MGRLPIGKRTVAAAYLVMACTLAIGPLILRFRRPPAIVIEAAVDVEEAITEKCISDEVTGNDRGTDADACETDIRDELTEQDDPTALRQQQIYIHVAGHVVKPGLYALQPSSRVHHAIEAAGGMTEKADKDAVNIALPIIDGQQVYIPEKKIVSLDEKGGAARITEEAQESQGLEHIPEGRLDVMAAVPLRPSVEEPKVAGFVDINTASQTELETLPGIGPSLAARIIDHRVSKGPFVNIEALMDVSGIGPAKFEALKDKVIAR